MAKKASWAKLRHAYICGEMSYRELAKKYDVPFKTLSDVAKKEQWVTKRRQFRDDVSSRAYTRARDEEVDELERIRGAADKLGAKLDEIMADEDQLYTHTAVLATEDGATDIYARKLNVFDPMKLTALTKAMKDMTAVLRDLHGISTRGEERADQRAQDKYELEKKRFDLEKKRFELEKEKAGADDGSRNIVIEIDPELAEGQRHEDVADTAAQ